MRIARRLVTLAVPMSLFATFGWTAAASSAPAFTNGHGLSSCNVTGSFTFTPPQKTGESGASTVGASLTLSSCGGNDFTQSGKTISGASATLVGRAPSVPTGCTVPGVAPGNDFAVSSFPTIKLKISWTTTTGKTLGSKDSMLNGLSTWTGANGPGLLPGAAEVITYSGVSRSGPSRAQGVFGTPAANLGAVELNLDVDQDYASQVTSTTAGCASSGGLSKITVRGALLLP